MCFPYFCNIYRIMYDVESKIYRMKPRKLLYVFHLFASLSLLQLHLQIFFLRQIRKNISRAHTERNCVRQTVDNKGNEGDESFINYNRTKEATYNKKEESVCVFVVENKQKYLHFLFYLKYRKRNRLYVNKHDVWDKPSTFLALNIHI